MKLLFLLRHAKSSWDAATLSDWDRPLNTRGRNGAAAMAGYFRSAGIRPAIVLCSPAVRTRQTLDAILPQLGGAPVDYNSLIYNADWQALLALIGALPETAASVLMVGHNPGLEHLALKLVDEAAKGPDETRLRQKFPTGALATIQSPATAWADLALSPCRLLSFVYPADLAP